MATGKALVLGGTGHIGAHVVRALLARGYDVRATYRNPRYRSLLDGLSVEATAVDLTDPAQVERALAGCDLVFHCAGYYPRFRDRRERALALGVAQVRSVLQALRQHRAQRVVFTSSAATIRSTDSAPATEADREPWPLPSWRPLYATVKIAMEREAERGLAEGLPIVFTHPSVCLGEYDAHSFSGTLILLVAKRRLPVYLDHHFNAVYTGDVAAATVTAAERAQPGEHFILSHRNVTFREFADEVARVAGVRPPRWTLPHAVAMAGAGVIEAAAALTRTEPWMTRQGLCQSHRLRHWLDNTKSQRELAMPQTPLDEAIRRAMTWFKAHGNA
jgi:dihydroflavonol-4-reductase